MAGSMKCLKHGSAPHWFGPVPVASSSDWGCEYLYFAIAAAKSHTKTKLQQTNIHNTSSNAKKEKRKEK